MLTREARAELKKYNTANSLPPNAMPPATFCVLPPQFGMSLSLMAARTILAIEVRGSSYIEDEDKIIDPSDPKGVRRIPRPGARPKPHYMCDINYQRPDGDWGYYRSTRTNLTKREALDLKRQVTRKIAEFVWGNRNVKLPRVLASPDVVAAKTAEKRRRDREFMSRAGMY